MCAVMRRSRLTGEDRPHGEQKRGCLKQVAPLTVPPLVRGRTLRDACSGRGKSRKRHIFLGLAKRFVRRWERIRYAKLLTFLLTLF